MLGLVLWREGIAFVGGDFIAAVVTAVDARNRDVFANFIDMGPVLIVGSIYLAKVLGCVICYLGHQMLLALEA
jgi:hypothetical protein